MGQVTFWSPQKGQSGNTTNMIATAALIGMEYVTRTLISHTHWADFSLESPFLKGKGTYIDGEYSDVGIDALERLVRSNHLAPNMVRNYTDPILRDRLEILRGTTKPTEEMFHSMGDAIVPIFDAAKVFYNLSIIDLVSGTSDNITNSLLQSSDAIVISLNQNLTSLETFFKSEQYAGIREKKHLIVIGQYDRHSKYSVNNIKRMFKTDAPVFTVPHSTALMDAMNDKTVVQFFLRNKNISGNHDNHYFLTEVRKLAKGIFDAMELDTKIYSEQGA